MTDDPIEQELRRSLQRRVAHVNARPDALDVERRAGASSHRSWRVALAACGVLVLPLAGVAIGRWSAPEADQGPSVVAGGADTEDAADPASVVPYGAVRPVTEVFSRESPTLTVTLWDVEPAVGECVPLALVGSANAPAAALSFPLPPDSAGIRVEPFELATGSVSYPFFAVATGDEIANVRSVGPDGVVDEMTPIDGWAVVSAVPTARVEGVANDGSIVPAPQPPPDNVAFLVGCVPDFPRAPTTTTTVPPTGPPPADEEDAREEVNTAITTAYNGSLSIEGGPKPSRSPRSSPSTSVKWRRPTPRSLRRRSRPLTRSGSSTRLRRGCSSTSSRTTSRTSPTTPES